MLRRADTQQASYTFAEKGLGFRVISVEEVHAHTRARRERERHTQTDRQTDRQTDTVTLTASQRCSTTLINLAPFNQAPKAQDANTPTLNQKP